MNRRRLARCSFAALLFLPLVATSNLRASGRIGQPDAPQAIFTFFADLIGGKWVTDGKWANGNRFKQEQVYELGLGGKIVKVKVFDIDSADPKTGAIGLRNEGIRGWDGVERKMKFWEFDRFGGITTGVCFLEQGTLFYEYDYKTAAGVTRLREAWTKIGKDEYEFKVGMFDSGGWTKVLLASRFSRVPDR